ncbi:hypothetical protein J3Q64DRAFT_1832217 [Phycomyces blakesleeanus]|uniref:Uncharacterized protein n=1 Tax=Phycomyces blakesleeanus TaxID=4837 RepID=A0ABR3B5M4_PHYBL
MPGIAQDLIMGVISRDKAIAHLLDLDLPINENKFKNCIINLIRKLPPVPTAEDTNELELSTRYVAPFLSGLFDDPDEDIYIRRLHGMTRASNYGYGRAKPAAQGGNNYSICLGLLCVGIFCKNALDAQNMEGVLGLQVIGRMVTLYVLVFPSTGLYVMYELEKIKIPSCLDNLTKLIVDIPRICRVLETFNRICKPSVHQAMPSRHRPTITTSAFNGVFFHYTKIANDYII